jgi:hypothetical protein
MLNYFCCGDSGLRLVELVEFSDVREISRANKRYGEHTCYLCVGGFWRFEVTPKVRDGSEREIRVAN